MSLQAFTNWLPPRQLTMPRREIITALPLAVILVFQSVLSLSLQNTAFQDEALYLYAGRQYFLQLLGGPAVAEPYGRYFSGLPFLYPLLAGALDNYGGLEVARLFSLLCMLLTTVLIFWITKCMFGRNSAVVAAVLFSVQGPILFLGRLATYDAMCILLLTLGLFFAIRADTIRGLRNWFILAIVLMLAVLSKYAGLLFVPPILAVLGWKTIQGHGLRRGIAISLWRIGIITTVMILSAVLLAASNRDIAEGLNSTTTARVALIVATQSALLQRAVVIAGPLVLLALLGCILSGRKSILVNLIFLGATLLAPAYHIYKTEIVSMHKHMAFSILFAAPLAGYAVTRLAGLDRAAEPQRRWTIALVIGLATFSLGFTQARGFYSEWSDSSDLITMLRTQVRPNGRILAEESEVPRYYLQDIVSFWQWNNLYWFYYTDKQGLALQDTGAYKAAIREGYWDLIVFRYGPNAAKAHEIDGDLQSGIGYTLITKVPITTSTGTGEYWVWRKNKQ